MDKNCPFNSLEKYIFNLRNHGNIILLGAFKAESATNQSITLSNSSNPDPLWRDEDSHLANKFKRKSKDNIEKLFSTELIKIGSSRDLIICNGIKKWLVSSEMTCFHALGSSVVDYAISDILVLNHITNFELLNGFEPDSDHRPMSLSLNLAMHTTHMQENNERKIHIHFDRSKNDMFLRDLEMDLGTMNYNNNIDQFYYHFTTILSNTISKFSNEIPIMQSNRTSNPCYEKNYKIAKKEIRDAPNKIIKL